MFAPPLQAVQIPVVAAQNPAAISGNRNVVMGQLSHSNHKKRKTLEEFAGGGGGAVEARNPDAIFSTFSEMQKIQNMSAGNTNFMAVLAGLAHIPDGESKTALQQLCIDGLKVNIAAMSKPNPLQPHPPPPNNSVVPLACSICRVDLIFDSGRRVYSDAEFTTCGHPFHPSCLRSWKASPAPGSNSCPDCRTVFPV